jgi:hypothetical protein
VVDAIAVVYGGRTIARAANRAAFEILTDDTDHGVELRA